MIRTDLAPELRDMPAALLIPALDIDPSERAVSGGLSSVSVLLWAAVSAIGVSEAERVAS